MICRFISRDSVNNIDYESIGGLNLYTYCGNDPISKYDPSGCFALTTLITLGLISIGAVSAFSAVMYADYHDDGQIFNGSIAWYDYLGATILGGTIGGLIGYFAAPSIAAMISSTGTIGGTFAFAGGFGITGGGIAISTLGEIALAGTAVLTGVGSFGASIMFASNNRPRNNRVQNKQVRNAIRESGYDPNDPKIKDIVNDIEKYIRKNKLNLGWKDLLELIREWLSW